MLMNMLKKANKMFFVYGKPVCKNCNIVKSILKANNVEFEYKDIDDSDIEMLKELSGKEIREVPQVLVKENGLFKYIGGLKQVQKYFL